MVSFTKKNRSTNRRKNKVELVILLIIFALILAISALSEFITEWLWFKEMGYVDVFFTKLVTQLKFGVPAFLISTILINFYLRRLKANYFNKIVSHENTNVKVINIIANLISLCFGGIIGVVFAKDLWMQLLEFTNSTDFNIKDPLFNNDVSFYVFKLEFLKSLNVFLILAMVLFVIITVVFYLILLTLHSPDAYEEDEAKPYNEENDSRNFIGKVINYFISGQYRRRRLSESNFKHLISIASGHLSVIGIMFFLMVAVHFYLEQFDLLHAHTGSVYGAGFTDVNVTLWVYRIVMGLSVLCAITVGFAIRKNKFRKFLVLPLLMVIVGVGGVVASSLVQNMVVAPDEINKEKKYLKYNIEYTQYAYGLNNVDVKPFEANNNLSVADLANNTETVGNIRINDYEPVKTFYNQTQSIRQYYKFNDIDVDRYVIDGKYTQTYMSMREIDENKINDTWLNRHLKYTHGYGLALSRVDTITPTGQPDVLIKNIPPVSSIPNIQITEPQIYFGELTKDYIIVNTSEDEFDYPNGNSNKYNKYKGSAGIKLNWFNRVLFSLREKSMKLLVSTNIKSDSRIIIHRNVVDRVKNIMPYLTYEEDPYGVTIDGKQYWIIDAYTTSSYYPYSEPYRKNGKNYVRNSIKIVIDAYNGDVNYYIVDDTDPIAKTYEKIYPSLFKHLDKMPKELQKHIRYPNNLVKIQAEVYARYHMNDVKVFYQNEDLWDIAKEIYGTEEKEMRPNYYIAKLPGEKEAEFISILPFTPKSKQNMTALMVARSDGDNYGQLVVYQFPKNKAVYGPMQIEAQIDQNTKISQDFSLWSQSGSRYSRGNLFVVPIENSILYVEPVYLEASNTAIPEVKRVIVAYGDKIAYEATLAECLDSLFGEGSGIQSVADNGSQKDNKDSSKLTSTDYIKMANEAYDEGQQALKDGDWAAYGDKMNKLKDALNHLVAK